MKEMWIKIIIRYHHRPIWLKLKNSDSIKFWQERGETESYIYWRWECKMIQPQWENYLIIVYIKINHATMIWPSNYALGHFPE